MNNQQRIVFTDFSCASLINWSDRANIISVMNKQLEETQRKSNTNTNKMATLWKSV